MRPALIFHSCLELFWFCPLICNLLWISFLNLNFLHSFRAQMHQQRAATTTANQSPRVWGLYWEYLRKWGALLNIWARFRYRFGSVNPIVGENGFRFGSVNWDISVGKPTLPTTLTKTKKNNHTVVWTHHKEYKINRNTNLTNIASEFK